MLSTGCLTALAEVMARPCHHWMANKVASRAATSNASSGTTQDQKELAISHCLYLNTLHFISEYLTFPLEEEISINYV